MPKLSDLAPGSRMFALFIGRSGSGKTGASASFPDPVDWDFDGRIAGLLPIKHLLKHDVKFERFMRPKGWLDIDAELDKIQMKILQRAVDLPGTLVFDTLGGFTRMMLSESLALQTGRVVGKVNVAKTATELEAKGLRLAGPGDYNYESSATHQVFDRLKTFPFHVIVNAHIIDRWGKDKQDSPDKITPTEVIGERLNVTDKLGETVLTYFDEVYRFEKKEVGSSGQSKHYVKFNSDMARSSLLGNLPGEHDITNRNFYEFWLEKIKEKVGK